MEEYNSSFPWNVDPITVLMLWQRLRRCHNIKTTYDQRFLLAVWIKSGNNGKCDQFVLLMIRGVMF